MAIEELAEEVVNEVATNLEEAAEATRQLNITGLGYLAVGLGLGAAVGFYFGYKFNREKIRAEIYKDAEAEVDMIRQVYLAKMTEQVEQEKENKAAEIEVVVEGPLQGTVPTEKPPIEEVITELGYGGHEVSERERPLRAPVPILDDLPENPVGTSKSMNAGWNYEREMRNRSPDAPYVIHQNEYNHSNLEYSKVEYTYYANDDVLVDNEDEHPVVNGDIIVGVDNLKFGHGADDVNVVHVRNDRLETDMLIHRIYRSYEEDVLGLDGDGMSDDGSNNADDN